MILRKLATWAMTAALLAVSACTKEVPVKEDFVLSEDQTALVLSAGMNGLRVSAATKAEGDGQWIQEAIGMTNMAMLVFDHESGEKVYATAKYPFKTVVPSQPQQSAWMLGNFTPDPDKTYDIAIACNFPKAERLNYFLAVQTWDELTDHEPLTPTFQMPRVLMSDPTTVASAAGSDENWPVVTGYRNYGGPSDNKMYVNQWRSPLLSGYIRDIKLKAGKLNLVGFQKESGDLLPAVDIATINSDLNSSYTAATLPETWDGSDGELDNAKRILTLGTCYAVLVVDGIDNATGGKLEITDIFMMNVPMFHHPFSERTYHFGYSPEIFKNTLGVTEFCVRGKDLVSGFEQVWVDDAFLAKTADDNFARLLHYPAENSVSQAEFVAHYMKDKAKNSYYFSLKATGQLLDRLSVSRKPNNPTAEENARSYVDDFTDHMSGNWNWLRENGSNGRPRMGLAYVTADVRKVPFFILSENLGDYPNENTVDENGDRQYLYATRLVIRGKWKETPSSEAEVVYYPIIVNGPNQGYNSQYASDSAENENNNFVHKGRRYIYNIRIESKGVYNPWSPSRVAVELGELELKVDMWTYNNVEIPKYIY